MRNDKRKTSTARIGAIFIAILDMIGCIVIYGICVYVIFTYVIPMWKKDYHDKTPVFLLSCVVVIAIIFNCIQLWAAVVLFKATNVSTNTKDALNGAVKWKIVATVYINLVLSACLVLPLPSIIAGVIKLIMVGIVHMYIRDLRKSLEQRETNEGDVPSVP